MSKNIIYNIYDRPSQPRNKFGVVNNSSILNSSNNIFSNSEIAASIDISGGSGSGSGYIPDFIGALEDADGVRGLVPAPLAGQQDYYLHGDGTWNEIPVMSGSTELGFAGTKGLVPDQPVGSYDYYLTGSGNWVKPLVFTPATSTEDGKQGEVPSPSMGMGTYHILQADGNWGFDAAHKWLKEFPETLGLEKSGLTIDGDFNVQSPHTLSTWNLEVEGRAHFWELIIDRVKANNGQLLVSPSNFKVDAIGTGIIYYLDEEPMVSIMNYRPDIKRTLEAAGAIGIKCYRLYMRNDDGEKSIVPSVAIGDMLRCRSFNIGPGHYEDVGNKDYWSFVLGVGSEQYREVPEGYDDSYGTANFIDLAVCILTEEDALPIDTIIKEDGETEKPEDAEPTYTIADLKDISEQVRTGNHDRMEEFPTQSEMDEITVAVLGLPNIPVPENLIDVDDYIFHYEPIIYHEPVSGAVPWDSPDYASELDKYNNDPAYADWKFGYGKIEISEGDELACLGHLFDTDRRNAIIISSNTPIDPELKAPSFAQYIGIDIFGLSISKFRLTSIARNGNYFYGWFGVESGDGAYMSVTDMITSTVLESKQDTYTYVQQTYDMLYSYVVDAYSYSLAWTKNTGDAITTYVGDSYNNLYSYITQKADGIYTYVRDAYSYTSSWIQQSYDSIYSYVVDAYSYSLSSIRQTADSIQTYVGDTYNSLYSYITQKADGIYTYVTNEVEGAKTYSYQTAYGFYQLAYDSYTYTLSYISQTADSISSTVQDLSTYTYSNITQLSDSIDLMVTKDDLEVVGIHLDGLESTVNIVGSLAVKQNGDGDIDTISVYDEDGLQRVLVTPSEIENKDSLINDTTWVLNQSSNTFTFDNAELRNTYINFNTITLTWFDTPQTSDVYTLSDFVIEIKYANDDFKTLFTTGTLSGTLKVEPTSGSGSVIGRRYFSIPLITASWGAYDRIIRIPLNDIITDAATPETIYHIIIEGLALKSNNVSTGYNFNFNLVVRFSGLISKTGSTSSTSFMEIGSNGFYYTSGDNKYFYASDDDIEIRNGDSRLIVDVNDVKIQNTVFSTAGPVFIGSDPNPGSDAHLTNASVVYMTGNGTSPIGSNSHVILYNVNQFGLGRVLTIIGFVNMKIASPDNDIIVLVSESSNNSLTVYKVGANTGHYLQLSTNYALIPGDSNQLVSSLGTIQLIALADGWHVINGIYMDRM